MDFETAAPDPVTLRFPEAALESRFNEYYRVSPVRFYRTVAVYLLAVMIALSVSGVFIEFSVNRENVQKLLWFANIPATVIVIVALSMRRLAGKAQWIITFYVLLMGLISIGFPLTQGAGYAMFYGHSYTMILLLLMFPLSRLKLASGAVLAAILIGGYLSAVAAMPGFSKDALLGQAGWLVAATVFGFSLAYLIELNVRRWFLARQIIEERERELRKERNKLIESEAQLKEEKEKSETLLLSVLPRTIADRLMNEGKSIADGIVECTVLFSDLVGFTGLAQEMGPRALVDLLNDLFSGFDDLSDQYGLEKIKTIGDAYMVAGGVPEYMKNHASAVADMALDMRDSMEQFNERNDCQLGIRIGMHSGPVIAGIIGTKKFSYDLWGDAVNMAARMESHGLPGHIQVTEATFLLLRRHFDLEERGQVEIKGKGSLKTYWLEGRSEAD